MNRVPSILRAALLFSLIAPTAVVALACVSSADVEQHDSDPVIDPHAIFVTPTGSDLAKGTSLEEAVATVQVGIERALGCEGSPCAVRIAEGAYEGPFELAVGVNIEGGYDPTFTTRDPATYLTRLWSKEVKTLTGVDITFDTRVDGVTIQGTTFDALLDGTNTYAVWIHGASAGLVFSNVTILAGNAADGPSGKDGVVSNCNALGGAGGVAFDCGGSMGTAGSADNDTPSGGTGGIGGDSNCPNACPLTGGDGISDGGPGEDGLLGLSTPAGAIATDTVGTFVSGDWRGALGDPGQRGKNGTGGGGGGSGGSKKFAACFGCSTLLGGLGGAGGRAGCGGEGGTAGGPGGGSFGLVLRDAKVTLENVTIVGGRAGRGGHGGDGAQGGEGDAGLDGDPRASQQCGAINYQAGAGGKGGAGGAGGRGGGGAGGVGGVSVGIALVGASEALEVGEVTVQKGEAGAGGLGGFGGAAAQMGFAGTVDARLAFANE